MPLFQSISMTLHSSFGCFGWSPNSLNSSLSEDFQCLQEEWASTMGPKSLPTSGAHPCRTLSRSQEGVMTLIFLSSKWFLTQKQKRCSYSWLSDVLNSSVKSKLECKFTPQVGCLALIKHLPTSSCSFLNKFTKMYPRVIVAQYTQINTH